MTTTTKTPAPQGVIPHLVVRGASEAISFYEKAFGARELSRMQDPAGKGLWHAALRIGDATIFLADEFPGARCTSPQKLGGTAVTIHMYVEDVDAVFDRAVAAGATVTMPPTDMFWGDRYGQVTDPFGHQWSLATHVEDVPPDQMMQRARQMMAQRAECGN